MMLLTFFFFLMVGVPAQTPDAAQAALVKGVELRHARKFDEAAAKLREAIAARNGEFSEAYFELGLTYFEADKITEAGEAFGRAVEQNEELPEAYRYVAEVALFDGDYEKATRAYEKYMDLLPPRDEARRDGLGRLSRIRNMYLSQYMAGQGDEPLQFLSRPRANFPEKADIKISGDVIIEAIFTADGQINHLKVLQALGKEFDEEAIKEISGLRFKPAIKNGKAVSSRKKLKIHFQKVIG